MRRATNAPCHARIMIDCTRHGHHVLHLSSADDMAWLAARALVDKLKADGFRVLLDQWQATTGARTTGNPTRAELADLDDVPLGPCPTEEPLT